MPQIAKMKNKFTFSLGETVRQTDVCTACKLLIYRIYTVQSEGESQKELVQIGTGPRGMEHK